VNTTPNPTPSLLFELLKKIDGGIFLTGVDTPSWKKILILRLSSYLNIQIGRRSQNSENSNQ
jgi:hypothetical protein